MQLSLYRSLFEQNYAVIIIIRQQLWLMQAPQRSSFHPSNPDPQTIQQNLLNQQCSRLISTKEPLQITSSEQHYLNLPQPLRLISAFYHALRQKLQYSGSAEGELTASDNFGLHHIKYPLFKLILTALQKKLFISRTQQKIYQESSYSLAYKSSLLPYLLSVLSQNTNYIPLERITTFYRCLTSDQYLLYLPIQLYFLFGGSLFTIENKRFKQKIVHLIDAIAKALSNSDTFISRNAQFYKNNKERKLILDQSIKVVMMAKNKQTLEETAQNITQSIFGAKNYLSLDQFIHILQNRPLDPTLTIFLILIRSELILIQQKTFQSLLLTRSEVGKTNFYSNEMTKLFNKCPFNGDERCNCKKCQCVRRNRQSAKLNQEKKRNAVEQVDSMKKRLIELESRQKMHQKKISELEQQNQMLKTLIKQIKMNHNMKSSLQQTIEPISKVLNNQLEP